MKTKKLTREMLKRIVLDEAEKFGKMADVESAASDADEVDADEYADTLEKKIDYCKALKIEESRLIKRLRRVRENRKRAAKAIVQKI